jgi:hypothetical protein
MYNIYATMIKLFSALSAALLRELCGQKLLTAEFAEDAKYAEQSSIALEGN